MKLGAGTQSYDYAAHTLATYDNHDAFARSYAYASGPAYGLLLDERMPNWRAQLGPDAPADLLARAIRKQPPTSSLEKRAAHYGGAAVADEGRTRAETQHTCIAQLRSRFSEGPRVLLPLKSMKMEFDPSRANQMQPHFQTSRKNSSSDSNTEGSDGGLLRTQNGRFVALGAGHQGGSAIGK